MYIKVKMKIKGKPQNTQRKKGTITFKEITK